MIDIMGDSVNTCTEKDPLRPCDFMTDTFGVYCKFCGFVKKKN